MKFFLYLTFCLLSVFSSNTYGQRNLTDYKKIVIVSSGASFEERLLIERNLAEALNQLKVNNVLSINIVPQNVNAEELDKDSIKSIIQNKGIDGVLVVRLEEHFKEKTKVKAGSSTPHSNEYDISYDDFILATASFKSGKKVAKKYIAFVTLKTNDDILLFDFKLKYQKSTEQIAKNITSEVIKTLKKYKRI